MKNYLIISAISLLISVAIYNCNETEEINNKAPTCTITSPFNNDEITQGEIVTIFIEFDDSDGIVTEVRLYIDSAIVALFFNFPYSYEWSTDCEKTGNHIIKAIVMDDDSISSVDEIVVILNEKSETGTVTDYDGNTYKTIKIGNQWWMTENLKTLHYADGTEISFENNNECKDLKSNEKTNCYSKFISSSEADIYGTLYTWTASMNGESSSDMNPSGVQGVCPTGWHLPSDTEWKQLEMYLGMNQFEVDEEGWRGTDEGTKLKDKCTGLFGYYYSGEINESGFTALPGGYRHNEGYSDVGTDAYFWSSTQSGFYGAWHRQLNIDIEAIFRYDAPKSFGYNVRCVRD